MATYDNPFPTSSTPNDLPAAGSRSGMTGTDLDGSVGASAESTVNRVVKGAHDVVDRLAEKAAPALDAMHTHAGQLNALQEEWMTSARTTVRDHPLAALGAAVVFGMLVARLAR